MARDADLLAAVDLGSNSFHLVVARFHHGQVSVIDRLREPVRLAAGVGPQGELDAEVARRALDCLERFGQRLGAMRSGKVRVVGTHALRRIRSAEFLQRARVALGHAIEVVAGVEEARLIYSGVAHVTPPASGRRLVIDIGGGSTEFIIGEGMQPQELASLQMGCVHFSANFFPDGRGTARRMQRARLAARQQLEPVFGRFRRRGWEQVLGCSGTIRAIADALADGTPGSQGIEADALERLADCMARSPNLLSLPFPSLTRERCEVIAGGVAILAEAFRMLGIERMQLTDGAMRDGLLYDLIGRMSDSDDARERTVRAMQQRYHVDQTHAARVESTAAQLQQQVAAAWELSDDQCARLLSWAARLHEIGLDVAHAKFHEHGAYLLQHADMPAFARDEQRMLALLVGNHRRRLTFDKLEQFAPECQTRLRRLTLLLRLAVLLHRSRDPQASPPDLLLQPQDDRAVLWFPSRWLHAHPLTAADLTEEERFLRAAGFRLQVFGRR